MQESLSTKLTAAVIVGTLDILTAFVYYVYKTSGNPLTILKYIASAIFGKPALAGGTLMILSGLVLHYLIAFAFTFFFFWLYARIKLASRSPLVTGIIYGVFVWCIMNLLVVPSSKIGDRPFNVTNAIINAIILIICIGIPLSILANRFYRKAS